MQYDFGLGMNRTYRRKNAADSMTLDGTRFKFGGRI